jgi:hypothetical protein
MVAALTADGSPAVVAAEPVGLGLADAVGDADELALALAVPVAWADGLGVAAAFLMKALVLADGDALALALAVELAPGLGDVLALGDADGVVVAVDEPSSRTARNRS